jgi:hypothetical protein
MIRAGSTCLLLALSSACSGPYPSNAPSPAARALLRDAPVVVGSQPPEIELGGFARGRGEGAGTHAGYLFYKCMGPGAYLFKSPFTWIVAAPWLAGCTIAIPPFLVFGAAFTPNPESTREAEGALRDALAASPMSVALRDEVLRVAQVGGVELVSVPDAEGGDGRLEVSIAQVGTTAFGVNPPLRLFMVARARIVRASDGGELFAADFRYDDEAEGRRLNEWSADGGAALAQALQEGEAELAKAIFQELFVFYPFPDQERHGGFGSLSFGLAPIVPEAAKPCRVDGRLRPPFAVYVDRPWVEFGPPLLRWQSFPRASDLAAQPDEMSRVENVRYDLQIARLVVDSWQVVYRREGLTTTEQCPEIRMSAGDPYIWSVRARFDLDGLTRTTEWSGFSPGRGEGVFRTGYEFVPGR